MELTDEGCQVGLGFIEDVLKHVIPKLILLLVVLENSEYLRQRDRILDEFFVELFSLLLTGVVDTTLEDTTAMFMSCDFNTIHRNSIVDELFVS